MTNYDPLFQAALGEIKISNSLENIENIRIKYFGKNGIINNELKKLRNLEQDKKKIHGNYLNSFKKKFFIKLEEKRLEIENKKITEQINLDFQDPSMPTRNDALIKATVHPITQTIEEVVSILSSLGLEYVEGPDIEDDFHNFTALNIPSNHPARQMHDTFYLQSGERNQKNVLRTHTSPVQIRSLMSKDLPIRIFAPGRTYRCDSDITHTPMFHQVEGLVVDENVNFANLKWFLKNFCQIFFKNPNLKFRFRPSFFPFTEPSAEVDINCRFNNKTITIGEGNEWLEILGCGMVHPNVFKACKINKSSYGAFAFGMGIERLAMLKYGMPDLRNFFDSDLGWLRHYGFSFLDQPDLN